MPRVRIKIVDAFTKIPQSGNPAGVVLDADDLSEIQMQRIARELNLSETVFVLRSLKDDADLHLRWFTPTNEVALCGHATIAAFHALAEEKRMQMKEFGEFNFHVDTASGILPVQVKRKNSESFILMGLNLSVIKNTSQPKVELVRILNIMPGDFDNKMTDECDGNLYVRVRRFHTLFSMRPNIVTMSYFLQTRNLQGLCVYTTETVDRESKVHSRFFAPTQGINEDPVTGSAHGPLAVILFRNGTIEAQEGRCIFQGEQGDAIGRRGRVHVELEVDDGEPTTVKIGGNAVTVLEGEMVLND